MTPRIPYPQSGDARTSSHSAPIATSSPPIPRWRSARLNLTAQRLRELLNYDPHTGVFTRPFSNGSAVGCVMHDGYRRIYVDGFAHAAHRLAWLYVYGEWPQGDLDHRNLMRDHNWIDNLRPASNSQNQANTRKPNRNTSGYKGVTYNKKRRKWQAQIRRGGKNNCLGLFASPEEAHAAYTLAAIEHFGEFARVA